MKRPTFHVLTASHTTLFVKAGRTTPYFFVVFGSLEASRVERDAPPTHCAAHSEGPRRRVDRSLRKTGFAACVFFRSLSRAPRQPRSFATDSPARSSGSRGVTPLPRLLDRRHPKDTYGAAPSSNASATGAADAPPRCWMGDRRPRPAQSSSRFWRDIGICVGALSAHRRDVLRHDRA